MEMIDGKRYIMVNDDGTLNIPQGFKLQQDKKKFYSEETRKKLSEGAKSRPRNGGKFAKKAESEIKK